MRRSVRGVGWCVVLALVCAALLGTPTKSKSPRRPQPASEDPINRMYNVVISDARVVSASSADIPPGAFTTGSSEPRPPGRGPGATPKVHPLLLRLMRERPLDERVAVVVTLKDEVAMPRFPDPVTDEPRDSAANKRVLRRIAKLVEAVERKRAPGYRALKKQLARELDARILRTYWIINGVVVDLPLRSIPALAGREDVLFVQPKITEDRVPIGDGNTNNDVADGRALIASDPYVNSGYGKVGWIGLLDTGVRFSHVQFSSLQISFKGDCVNGGTTCLQGKINPEDDCNHGTSSAAILVANASQGNDYRGVAQCCLDSWKVYPGKTQVNKEGLCTLDADAAVVGFQSAAFVADKVIVAEIQATEFYYGAIASAANKASDTGAVVVAANGNSGPGAETVTSPALGARVLGIGARNVETLAQPSYQSRGAVPFDLRIKPDVQTPTDTETASNASDTALKTFGGTSGSTPFAGGAAAVSRKFLRDALGLSDPGQTYAWMILAGRTAWPDFDNITGVGRLRLPTKGCATLGKVALKEGQTATIGLDITGCPASEVLTFSAALWWPELLKFGGPDLTHNNIDLDIIDPGFVKRAESASIESVFERARAAPPYQSGQWLIRIRASSMNALPQQIVYFVVFANRDTEFEAGVVAPPGGRSPRS